MEQRLTIIGLGVSDLKSSTSFYQEKFGWQLFPSSNDNISFFRLNGILLSLYPRDKLAEDAGVDPTGSGFNALSLAYNTKSKEEVDRLFREFEEKEVTIVKKPEEVFWGGYSGYVCDPDNNLWEIAYNPFLEMDEKGNTLG